jgi:hypothetical protein
MDPFEDLILYDIDPESMTDLELETLYDEMIEGGEGQC